MAVLLLLGNPSKGFTRTGNTVSIGNVNLSNSVIAISNSSLESTPAANEEAANLFSAPLPAQAPGDQTVCEGVDVSFTASGGTTYQWEMSINNGSNWSTIAGQTGTSLTLNAVTFGISGYQYHCLIDGVAGSAATLTVNPLPVAPGTITGTSVVCQGQNSVSYIIPVITNATSYTWAFSGSGATISNGTNNSIFISFGANASSGNLTVMGTNACGNGIVSANFQIFLNPLPAPAGTINGSPTVCQGQNTVVYSVGTISSASSYSWSYSGTGATISNPNSYAITINFGANATSGNLTVKGINACGDGTISANYPVTVNPLPNSAGAISGTHLVCQGQNAVSYLVGDIANANNYTWSYSGSGVTISNANTSNISINYAVNATSGNLTVKGSNACGDGIISASYPITVSLLPVPAGTISGSASACQGQNSFSYTVPVITNATGYSWSFSGTGATITSANTNSVSISFASNASSGNLTVVGTNSCGSGTVSSNYLITVNPLPVAAGSITGSPTVCQGQNAVNFSVNAITNATSYTWAYSGTGVTINNSTSNNVSINFAPNATSGNLTVMGTNACGNGIISTNYAITVNAVPTTSGTITGTAAVCQGQSTVPYSVGAIPGATGYTWAYSGTGAIINGTTNNVTINFAPNATSGNLTVLGTNSCGNGAVSSDYIITVNPIPVVAGSINGTAVVCQGSNAIAYSVGSILNATSYTWTYSGTGATINNSASNNISINFAANATSGNLTVSGSNLCANGAVSASYPITISLLPATAGSITGSSAVCQGQSSVIYSIPAIINVTGYSWTVPTGAVIVSGNNTNSITVDFLTGAASGNVTVQGTNSCGAGTVSNPYFVTVTPMPVANAGSDATICKSSNYVISDASALNYTSVNWTTINGDGHFIQPTWVNNLTYVPGPNDISTGFVDLILTATGSGPCSTQASDHLHLTIQAPPTADAGSDAQICQGTSFTVSSASGTNQLFYSWISTGTGTLVNTGTLNPTYTPSAGETGNVTLTLTSKAISPCTPDVTDQMVITIIPQPVVYAGPAASICGKTPFTVGGATAINYTSVRWTGNGSGSITNPTSLTPTYTPSDADLASGSVILTLSAKGNSPCADVTDSFILTINQNPTVNAGADGTLCTGPFTITGATAANQGVLTWTTHGDGHFTNANLLSPIYEPGTTDIINGTVTLTLTASAASPCNVTATDDVIYTVINLQSNAGGNATICQSSPYTLASATASGYATIRWSTSGSGSFTDINIKNPTYSPSVADIANGAVVLTLTADHPPCTPVSSSMVLTINSNPVAYAGTDASICAGTSYIIYNASALHVASVVWSTTAGTGSLVNPTSLSPTYTPSAADVAAGSVSLTMTALAKYPCLVDDVDVMTIFLTPQPTASAGSDASICEGDVHTISGSSGTHYSSLDWITNGDGSFTGGNTLYPNYTPGTNDKLIGVVTLTLTTYGILPCSVNATDQMLLTIKRNPIIVAGPDATICEVTNFAIISATAQHAATLHWTTSGTGTFSDATALLPIYYPSSQDIATGIVTLKITGTSAAPCLHAVEDQLLLTIISGPAANAGTDATICENSNYPITTATASSYSSITWTTSGDGNFSNVNIVNPVYTAGTADIAAGTVNLTLTSNSQYPCTGTKADAMVLTISHLPVVFAGNNTSICEGSQISVNSATVQYSTNYSWSTNGSGSFSNASLRNPIYTPSAADINQGNVTLTLSSNAVSPCTGTQSDSFVLTIVRTPTANAGPDAPICEGSFTITNATANSFSTLNWTTSGTGTFSGNGTITPIYSASIADITAGTVTLTLTASPNSPCGTAATDAMTLTILPFPTAYAGAPHTICEGTSYPITDATATHYSSIIWTTSGTGSFANAATLTPTYTPSAADIISGSVVLTLSSTGISPCSNSVQGQQTLTIQSVPVVDAGPVGLICQGGTFSTNGAVVSNAASTLWTSSGTGTFLNASQLSTTYTPSAADITNGGATLTLTALSKSPCSGSVSDTRILSITPISTAYAGVNATICANATYTISGATATHYSSLAWTTSGTGTFTAGTTLTPTYFPSAADNIIGSVILTLKATPAAPCPADASSSMVLTLDPVADVYAGADAPVCENGSYTINDATAHHNATIVWSTNGTGTFTSQNTITPTYSPSSDDVAAGNVILTSTVTSLSPCVTSVADNITLTVTKLPIVNAGPNGTTCGASGFSITQATQSNAISVKWTTSGNGIFSNDTQLNPVYTPSVADIAAGTATLKLTGISGAGCSSNPFDTFILTIIKPATANAGADASVCQNGNYTINDASSINYTALNWTSTGTGTLTGGGTLTPTYTPSAADLLAGTVTLTLHASAASPCTEVTDQMTLSVIPLPLVNAGPDANTCSGTGYSISSPTASNYSSVHWVSNGTGTFSNSNILLPVYTASAADIAAGHVNLTLTIQPLTPCSGAVSDLFILTFIPAATSNAGTDYNICEGSTFTVSTASATEYISLNWTTSGTGIFSSASTLTPTYTPSAADIAAGSVILTLHSSGNPPCATVTDNMTLVITHSPLASAGAGASICEGDAYPVTGASASSYSSLLWTTTGSGTLSNPATLSPTYLPASGETGSVTFTLTAYATTPCTGQVSSSKVLLIQPAPTANAGADATICQSNNFTVSGATAANYLNLNWTTSGTGTFTGNNTLTPTYLPSSGDFSAGLVTLTLHVNGINPCNTAVTDDMILHLVSSPTASAGPDATICKAGSYTVIGAAVAHESAFSWATSGTGTLANQTTLTPTYTAGPNESGSITLTLTAEPDSPCASNVSDQMIISIQVPPTSNAGADATVCEGTTQTLSGTVTNYASFSWSTNGSGSFANSNTLTPTYTSTAADVAAGNVIITLTAIATSPCSVNATDAMTLTLVPASAVNAGTDAAICITNSYLLAQSSAGNTTSISWSTSGDGTFSNSGSLHPTYTPGTNDNSAGQVTLTLTGQPSAPCTSVVHDAMILTINNLPTANAGADVTICEGSYTLSGAIVTHYSTLLWTSSGTGTLTNGTTATPSYTPSSADITSGTVTLTLTANSISPCTSQVSDAITLTIIRSAVANSGSDATICQGSSYTVNNATASNFTMVNWTHNGNGTLTNSGTLSPTYNPSPLDLTTGFVTLTLIATSNAPCTNPGADQMVIHIMPLPVVDAGPAENICTGTFTVSSASATNYASLLWTSSGSGTITNAITLNPTYTPSAADILAGNVTLTLHALSNSPCSGEVTDVMILTILPTTTVQAGVDATICSGDNCTLSGSSTTYSSAISWTSSGDGTFSSSTTLHPVYFPGSNDKANGSVILTLSATGNLPCNNIFTDVMVLTINPVAISNAGSSASICQGNSYNLTAATASHYSTISWITSGTGTFSNSTVLNPSYAPSAADISSGAVTLTLNAAGSGICSAVASSQIILTITHPAQANSGPDASICAGNYYYIPTAAASNYSNVYWVTSGTGNFLNGTSLTPTYQPGATDFTSGSVTLTLHARALSPCSGETTDGLILTILPAATASAGGDATICTGSSYTLTGTQATLYTSLNWTTSGSGSFSNNTILNPTYVPSTNDKLAGSVTLTLNVVGISPCSGLVADSMILTIAATPSVNAGDDGTACSSAYIVNGASASHYNIISWTTSGTGTFTNGNSLSPTYSPSVADLNTGSVRLWLNATSNSPCALAVSDDMLLTLPALPTANSGNDATICQGSTFQPIGASAANYSSYQWTTSGSGTFANAGTLTPTYSPGSADIASGTVTLTLSSVGLPPCNNVVLDAMVLTISKSAICDAGPSATICAGANYTISGASASNYSTLLWTTSGTGTFQSFNQLNPVYIPSASDIAQRSVNLTLTAYGNAPCTGNTSDVLVLNIIKNITVDAGPDNTVCYPAPFIITGSSADNYLNLSWSSSGTGSFINATTLHPTYFPSANDFAAGSVVLTQSGNGNSPCTGTASDIMILTVNGAPGSAGNITGTGSVVCQGQNGVSYGVPSILRATGYIWSLPTGATIISGTNTHIITVNYSNNAISGTVRVYGTNTCGDGAVSADFPVTVNSLPAAAGLITGLADICQGSTGIVYSIPEISSATSYQWSLPPGASITSGAGTNSITLDYSPSATAATLSVFGVNSCGNGTASSKSIVTHANPSAPAIVASGPTTFCEGGNVTFTGAASGYSYLWTPGSTTTKDLFVTSAGTYSLVVTELVFGCVSAPSNAITVTVQPAPPTPTGAGFIKFCLASGSSGPIAPPLNATNVTTVPIGTSIVWFDAATGGNVIASPTLNTFGSVTYYAEAQNNITSCPSLNRKPVTLSIENNPATPVKGPDITICETNPISSILATTSTPPPAGITINWYTTPTGGSPVSPTLSSVGTKTYYAEASNGICVSNTRSAGVVLTILPAPTPPVSGGDITQCAAATVQTLTAIAMLPSGLPTGSSIIWYDQSTNGNVVTSPTLDTLGAVTYYAETRNFLTNCASLTRTPVTLLLIQHPDAPVTSADITICETAPLQTLTATATVQAGSTIKWYNKPTGGVLVSPTLNTVGIKLLFAESDNGICTSLSRSMVTLKILAAPSAPASTGDLAACEAIQMPILDARNAIVSATGISIKWYDAPAFGAEVIPALNTVGTVTYYAEATENGCISLTRKPVKLTINPAPVKPSSKGDTWECAQNPVQTLNANSNITNLPSGNTTIWYTALTGGSIVANPVLNSANTSVTYYAAFKNGTTGCESLLRTGVKLTIAAPPAASASSNSPVSIGSTLTLSGGPDGANFTYLWRAPNGFTFATKDVSVPNITANGAGSYKLTVTDQNGCTSSDSITVVISMAAADYSKPVCLGGTLYLSGLPNNMASYAWTGPDGFSSSQQNPFINNASIYKSGDYTLTVVDAKGFTSSATVNVSIKSPPIAIAGSNTPVCAGSTLNLTAGPNGMTSYQWTGPNGFTSNLRNPSIPNYNPVASENFTLHIVDWNGCQATDTVTTTVFKPKATTNSPLCDGDTLRLRAEPNGMTSYKWTGPNGFTSTQQNPVVNGVTAATAAGQYTLTVVNSSGCSASTSINVAFNQPPPTLVITSNGNPACEGSTFILTGAPSGLVSYSWAGPNGFSSAVQNPLSITNVTVAASGKYRLTVTNAAGCSNFAEITQVINSSSFTGTYGPYCINDSPVTLSALPAGGTFSGTGVQGNVFTPSLAGAGSHTISYAPSSGTCPVTPIIIAVVAKPVVKTIVQAQKDCSSTVDLTLAGVTTGSTPGLVFTYWTNAGATSPLANPKTVTAGTYYIKGAAPSGTCFDIQPVTVNPSNSLQAKIVSVSPTCIGLATGTMTATVNKGTAPYTYLWSTNPVQTTATAKSLIAGIYSVTITDASSCSITLTDTLKDHPALRIYIQHKNIACLSDANGSARVDSINGSGKPADLNLYTYSWNTTPAQTTREALRLSYGYHSVTMTDANGCGIKDSILIDVLDTIPPTISCPKDIERIIHQTDGIDTSANNQNTIIIDLGKPVVWDNCGVASITNDAPEKFRIGITEVIWTVTDFVGLTDTCMQIVTIKALPVIPKLFSPNGDGINDNFEIDGLKDFPKSQLNVFTRSGQLVYSNEDYKNDWDGRFMTSSWSHNQIVAPGVYYYILNLGGATQKLQGFVYIYY